MNFMYAHQVKTTWIWIIIIIISFILIFMLGGLLCVANGNSLVTNYCDTATKWYDGMSKD